jgi:hypothetical protein
MGRSVYSPFKSIESEFSTTTRATSHFGVDVLNTLK